MEEKIVCFIECSCTGAGEACAREARSLGFRTYLVSRNPEQYSEKILRFIDKNFVCETNNLEGLLSFFENNPDLAQCDAVMTTNDFYVRQTSLICDKLKLNNIGLQASKACHYKKIMRECFDKAELGALNPKYTVKSIDDLNSDITLEKIIQKIGFPFVIKPIDGNDSLGVSLIKTENDLSNYILWAKTLINDATDQEFSREFLIEEYIIAEEFSVEVLVNEPNELILIGAFIKELWGNENAPFIKIGSAFPYQGPFKQIIKSEIPKAIKAIDAKSGILNIDCKIKDGALKIIEINGRMVGDQMGSHIIPMATGYNLARAAVQISLGLEPDQYINIKNKFIGIYRVLSNKKGTFIGIRNEEHIQSMENLCSLEVLAPVGKSTKEPTSNQDVVASVICKGASAEDALKTAKKISNKIIINYA